MNVSNTSDSWDSFMKVILPDVSQYRGVSMTLACSLTAIDGSAAEGFNGLLWIWIVGGAILKASDGETAKVGRKNMQFTLPSDATTLELRWYAPKERGTFQWQHPILTRTADYQRMLNGIYGQPMDYFDGDLMPLQN